MDNLKGMAWMTLSMLGFALADMSMVFMSRDLPIGQIILLLGSGGAVVFGIWAKLQGHAWLSPVLLMRPVMVRNGAEILAVISFVTAISLIPLSLLSAVIQANPLLVTMGAALFLGERVGWRRWTAIAVGLLGVMLILSPGTEGFDWNILWAVAAAIGLSMRDLATRPVPKSVPTVLLASYSFAALVVAAIFMVPLTGGLVAMTPALWGWAAVCVGFSLVALFGVTTAMRIGDISAVTPLRYTRLVFAFIIAIFVFGESLELTTVLGVSIVIATGCYSFWREGRLDKAT